MSSPTKHGKAAVSFFASPSPAELDQPRVFCCAQQYTAKPDELVEREKVVSQLQQEPLPFKMSPAASFRYLPLFHGLYPPFALFHVWLVAGASATQVPDMRELWLPPQLVSVPPGALPAGKRSCHCERVQTAHPGPHAESMVDAVYLLPHSATSCACVV